MRFAFFRLRGKYDRSHGGRNDGGPPRGRDNYEPVTPFLNLSILGHSDLAHSSLSGVHGFESPRGVWFYIFFAYLFLLSITNGVSQSGPLRSLCVVKAIKIDTQLFFLECNSLTKVRLGKKTIIPY